MRGRPDTCVLWKIIIAKACDGVSAVRPPVHVSFFWVCVQIQLSTVAPQKKVLVLFYNHKPSSIFCKRTHSFISRSALRSRVTAGRAPEVFTNPAGLAWWECEGAQAEKHSGTGTGSFAGCPDHLRRVYVHMHCTGGHGCWWCRRPTDRRGFSGYIYCALSPLYCMHVAAAAAAVFFCPS